MSGGTSAADLALAFENVSAPEAASPELRAELLDLWVAVTDAGGAVGFVAPADPVAIGQTLDLALERVASGRDALGVLRQGGRVVGMGFLVRHSSALRVHWRTVLRVMVAPELQGQGAGGQLLEGLHAIARELGLEQLQLTVRGGHGTEAFYERFGYAIVGRHPDAVRVGPGDDRDEILLVIRL